MKRSVVSLIIIGLHLLILTVALRLPVAADSLRQTGPTVDATATPAFTPFQLSVRQQVPLALTIRNAVATTDTLTNTAALTETVAVTLDLHFDLTFTNTVTATVPSTITITFADQQTTTLPISLTVALTPTAAIVITPLAPLTVTAPVTATASPTATEELTATAELTTAVLLTPTFDLTTTVPPQILNPTIVSSVAITANLRSGPDTTFDLQTTISPGQSILVVAQNADGTWYLINNGLWIAAFLVENPPANLPIATEDLVTTLREQNPLTPTVPIVTTPVVTTTAPVTTTTPVTTTPVVTEEISAEPGLPILVPTATPALRTLDSSQPVTTTADAAPAAETTTATAPADAQPPTTTVDANLREGPGTAFPINGGTITGQALNIVARNEDGSWFLLDNGGWVAAFLVANAPDPANVPLFDANGPQPTAPAPTTILPPTFGVQENLYVIRVDGIADRYDFALAQIENLVARAQNAPTLLENQEWTIQMTTMITLLRSAGDELQSLAAPAIFADVQGQLVEAATAYSTAAGLLAEAIDQLQAARLTDANAQVAVGNQRLGAALDEIERLTP